SRKRCRTLRLRALLRAGPHRLEAQAVLVVPLVEPALLLVPEQELAAVAPPDRSPSWKRRIRRSRRQRRSSRGLTGRSGDRPNSNKREFSVGPQISVDSLEAPRRGRQQFPGTFQKRGQ